MQMPKQQHAVDAHCRHVEAQLSGTHSPQLATLDSVSITVGPLNAMTRALVDGAAGASPGAGGPDAAVCSTEQLPCFVLLDDAWRGTCHLQDTFESMQRPLYGVPLPQVSQLFLSVVTMCFLRLSQLLRSAEELHIVVSLVATYC